MKVWCSNCGFEGEGELQDRSYLDEDSRRWQSGEVFVCSKCGFSTGSKAIDEHWKEKRLECFGTANMSDACAQCPGNEECSFETIKRWRKQKR